MAVGWTVGFVQGGPSDRPPGPAGHQLSECYHHHRSRPANSVSVFMVHLAAIKCRMSFVFNGFAGQLTLLLVL